MVGLDITFAYRVDRNWSANVGASFGRLQGDAAKSPIAEKRSQESVFAGVRYTF
jgi:outer membrane scaffolding protein for murein synthesis (MipA/OmpV family)